VEKDKKIIAPVEAGPIKTAAAPNLSKIGDKNRPQNTIGLANFWFWGERVREDGV
jgi:hypothetical protein